MRTEDMFDQVKFGVSDYAASKAFFLKALDPLGMNACPIPRVGMRISYSHNECGDRWS